MIQSHCVSSPGSRDECRTITTKWFPCKRRYINVRINVKLNVKCNGDYSVHNDEVAARALYK